MKEKNQVIGVDLGGTKIKAGRINKNDIVSTASNKVPESGEYDAESVIKVVIDTISEVFNDEIAGIGIGIPSVVDRRKGIIYDVQNIKSWKEVPLKRILEERFHVPVFIDNDANCFAIGEKLFGKGKNYDDYVGITIGTGIGGGIVNKGSLISDANCGSGEFGMLPYLDGIIEDYCSGQFFKNKLNVDGFEIFKKAESGDKDALNAYREFGKHLGVALKCIMYTVDPELIIIGGSIADSRKFFEQAMTDELNTFAYPMSLKNLKIEYSELAGDSQVLGAAAVYYDAVKNIHGSIKNWNN